MKKSVYYSIGMFLVCQGNRSCAPGGNRGGATRAAATPPGNGSVAPGPAGKHGASGERGHPLPRLQQTGPPGRLPHLQQTEPPETESATAIRPPPRVRVHVRPHLPKRNPLVRLALCPASLVENLRQRKRRRWTAQVEWGREGGREAGGSSEEEGERGSGGGGSKMGAGD